MGSIKADTKLLLVFGVSATRKSAGRKPFCETEMVVSSLKIAWHVPPMPGNRFLKSIIRREQKSQG
jgi:hypothetical protein